MSRARDLKISAYADYGHDHLVFARQQSQAMRAMAWENRVTPLKSWTSLLGPWLGLAGIGRDHSAVCNLDFECGPPRTAGICRKRGADGKEPKGKRLNQAERSECLRRCWTSAISSSRACWRRACISASRLACCSVATSRLLRS